MSRSPNPPRTTVSRSLRTPSTSDEIEATLWPVPPLSSDQRYPTPSGPAQIHSGDVLESLEGQEDQLLVVDRVLVGNQVCFLLFSASANEFTLWSEGDVLVTQEDSDPPHLSYNKTTYALHSDVVNAAENAPLATTTTTKNEDQPDAFCRAWYPYNDPPSLLSEAAPTAPDRLPISGPTEGNGTQSGPDSTVKGSTTDLRNTLIAGDAHTELQQLPDNTVTGWVTSPPYPGQQRDYDHDDQMATGAADEYLAELLAIIDEAFRVTHPQGTGWLVIDDTITDGEYCGVPDRLIGLLKEYGYNIIHNGPFVKTDRGSPDPAPKRFSHDHERVIGIAQQDDYHFDREALTNDSDVLEAPTHSHSSHQPPEDVADGVNHDAPYPAELIDPIVKAITPNAICSECQQPYKHIYEVTDIYDLAPNRHRERVLSHVERSDDFTKAHAWACRTVGLSDTGQASRTENGPEESNKTAQELYKEIEDDDFDFPQSYRRQFASYVRKHQTGTEQQCDCPTSEPDKPIILDPFVGIGTTPYVARRHGADYIGIDLNQEYIEATRKRLSSGINTSLTQFGK